MGGRAFAAVAVAVAARTMPCRLNNRGTPGVPFEREHACAQLKDAHRDTLSTVKVPNVADGQRGQASGDRGYIRARKLLAPLASP